jgi:hypothetical protein
MEKHDTFTDGLRKLAALVDANPEVADKYPSYRYLVLVNTRGELVEAVREFGGQWRKESNDSYYGMTRDLGGGVTINVCVPHHAVCERVVTGTRVVTRPAQDAPMIEVEEDVVEWVCPPTVLGDIDDLSHLPLPMGDDGAITKEIA